MDQSGKTTLGEDVVGLLLHQHGHVLNITAPEVQLLLHAFDLKQWPTDESQSSLCVPDESLPKWFLISCSLYSANALNISEQIWKEN